MADLASLVIKVDSRDVERARSGLNALGIDAQRAERSVSGSADRIKSSMGGVDTAIRAAAAALATFAGARAFVQIADQMKLLESRIRLTMTATEDFTAIQRQLVQVANSSRSSLQDIGTLYARLAVPIQKLGGTTNETVGIANALSKALLLSGASAQEASSAIIQFSQAMGKGVLNGDEFRSIAENAPIVLRLMEQQLGKTNAELRKMAEDGKLTADVIGNVLLANLNDLEKQASTIPMTVGQAFVLFKNNLALAVDEFEKATGAAAGLANIVGSMASSIGPAIRLLTDLAKILFQFEGSAQAFEVFGQAVKIAFQTILVVGGNVAFVLRGIVQEVVTLGRQAVSVFQGDFATAANIGARSARDAEQARVAFDAWEKSVMNFGQASKDAGGQAGTAAQEFRKLGNGVAEVDEKAKKAAEALRKLREQFAAQIADQRLINTLIMQGMEAEQARERVQLARAGALGAEIEQLTQLRAQEDALLETRKMMVEEIEAEDKALVDLIKSYEKNTEDLVKQNDALAEQVRAQLNQNEALGLTGEALALVEANRIRETQAQLQQKIATLEGIQGREAEIEQMRRQIDLLDELADARIAGAVKADDIKRAKEAIEVQQKEAQQLERIFQDVGRSLTDSLFRGFESGKGFLRSFKDSIVNTFKSLVIRFAVQPVLTSIAGSIAGSLGFSGVANAASAAGGFGGGLGDALSLGRNVFGLFQGGLSSALSGVQSFFTAQGFQSGAAFISGLAGGLGTFTSVAPAITSTALGTTTFFGGATAGTAASGLGAALGSALPFIGGALALGGLFGLFGSKPKAIRTSINETAPGEFERVRGKAGFLDKGQVDPTLTAINKQFRTVLEGLLGTSASSIRIGVSAGLFDNREQSSARFRVMDELGEILSQVDLKGSAKKLGENLQKLATESLGKPLRDAFLLLAEDVSDTVREYLEATDDSAEIQKRLGIYVQLQDASDLLNDKFSITVDQMIQMANAGADVAASLQALDSLLTPMERYELQIGRVEESFTALGLSLPRSSADLRTLINAVDKTSEGGVKLAGDLIALIPAFQQVEAARAQALAAADQQIAEMANNIAAEVNATASAFDEIIRTLRDFRQELDFIAGDTGPFALSIRRAQFEGVARRAALGDVEAARSLPDVGRGLLEVAAERSATREDFLRELARVRSGVDAAEDTAVRQKSIAEQQLDALNAQLAGLFAINTGVLTVADRMGLLAQAIAERSSLAAIGAGGSLESILAQVAAANAANAPAPAVETPVEAAARLTVQEARAQLGRGSGLSAQKAANLLGVEVVNRRGEVKLPGFANGGMFSGGLRIVGENGPELEATGPSRIWNAQQTSAMMSGGDMTGVENRLERVEAALFTIAKNTARTSDQLQRWDGDGVPPVRDEAA